MEKFSNNREDYWNRIKAELLDSDISKGLRFRYLEMGQLFSYGFSITHTDDNPKQLVLKFWNAEYDNKRFDKGIFNLDRLAIIDREIELNPQELEKINRLLGQELSFTNWGGIVLDGLFCQMELKRNRLNWNCNEEINSNLTELVELLRNKVAHTIMEM